MRVDWQQNETTYHDLTIRKNPAIANFKLTYSAETLLEGTYAKRPILQVMRTLPTKLKLKNKQYLTIYAEQRGGFYYFRIKQKQHKDHLTRTLIEALVMCKEVL